MSIECIHCNNRLTPEEVFGGAIDARRGMWNGFKCPHCNSVMFFVLKGKRLEIGMIDGFPGPVFEPESDILVPSLEHHWSDSGLKINMGANEWLIPYK